MAIDLEEGEIVAVPPAGVKRIVLDSAGDPKLLSSDGTEADLGGGTVNVAASLSGDGSVGNPLATDVGLITTATGAVQNLTVSGLLGDTDGGYEIEGNIITTAAAPDYVLYINGATVAAGGGSAGTLMTSSIGAGQIFTLGLKTDLYIGSNNSAEISNIAFRIRMGSKTGLITPYSCMTLSRRSTGTVFAMYDVAGQFTPGAQITSVAVHASSAGTIDIGSYLRVRRLGFLA